MAVAATILAVVWFLTALALRIAIQISRHGDTGVRADGGPRWSAGWWARGSFGASSVCVAVAPALVATGALGTVSEVEHPAAAWGGSLLASAGIVATFVAQLAMGSEWRIGVDETERTELVTTGMFATVRNPIFTAMVATATGLTLMAPTLLGLVALLTLLVSIELQVRTVEEPYLRRTHGAAYDAYVARTGRFVPRIGRRHEPGSPSRRDPGAPVRASRAGGSSDG